MAVSNSELGHHVFLSFSAEDVRNNFLSHLYAALCRKKIRAFKDDVKIEPGEELSPRLCKAIEEAKVSVVIFSKNYASSTRCLNELVRIMQCTQESNQNGEHSIIPVFYDDVRATHVRKQEGLYQDAFDKLEERFKNDTGKVREWRDAMTSAADFAGCSARVIRPESKLVDKIVRRVMKLLHSLLPTTEDMNKLSGIQKYITAIQPLLENGSPGVRIIGIWGASGAGKKTLARVLFNKFSSKFESCYFLENVREELLNNQTSTTLRRKLFAGLLEEENPEHFNLWTSSIKATLCTTKVLIVLDDVSGSENFDSILLKDLIQFGNGSVIIVTTADLQVLMSIRDCEKYKVEELNKDEALRFFQLNAFENGNCPEDLRELSEKMVETYAGGNPFALKSLGSYLYPKSKSEWERELVTLNMRPFKEIQSKLGRSYDDLNDDGKEIFLDIACFFKGEERDFVESLLDTSDFKSHEIIEDLINKSLITIRQHNKLWMHSMIQERGRDIVCKKSRNLAKRSRFWKAEDIRKLLRLRTAAEAVEGIFLDVTQIENPVLRLRSAAFSKMTNLRFLKIYKSSSTTGCTIDLSDGLESLPESLFYFYWHGYPLKWLPSNFIPVNLVELSMPYSQVQELWKENQDLEMLKRIDLSHSVHLIRVPDLSSATNLESINLEYCESLLQFPPHQNLDKLASLNLNGCASLQYLLELPRNITSLNLKNCTALKSIPANIYELKSLSSLNLSGCSILKNFPEISKPMECLINLKILILDMCDNLESLHESISSLYFLQSLSIRCCPKLECLPALPKSLASLDARGCISLTTVVSSKAVTEGWNCNHHNVGTFIFYNCLNLDRDAQKNIMADALLRIMHIANATSTNEGEPDMTEICWHGNEIPKWFKLQSKKSSIRVGLSSDHLDDTFLGFIFCIVVDFKGCNLDGDFRICCKADCVFPYGLEATWHHTWTWHWNHHDYSDNNNSAESQKMDNDADESACRNSVNSPHVFLFYDKGYQIRHNLNAGNDIGSSSSVCYNEKNVPVTFEFHPRDSNERDLNPSNCQVKSCGIRLLYAHDIKNLRFNGHDFDEETLSEQGVKGMVEDVEPMVDNNKPQLQQNGTHSEENDKGKSVSSCLHPGSSSSEVCDLSFREQEGSATSSQSIRVQKAQWLKFKQLLEGLNDQNGKVDNGIQHVNK